MGDEVKNDAQEEQINSEEVFGKPQESNAFGITGAELPKTNDELPAEEKPVETPKEEVPKEEKPVEEKPVETVKDDLLEQLKKASPEFAEICEKKKFASTKDAFKAYVDQEKEFTRRSAERNNYKKLLEPYFTFDEQGNVTGYTEEGKKAKEAGQQLPTQQQAQAGVQAQQVNPEDLNKAFWEQFEKDGVGTIAKIVNAVVQHNIGNEKGNFSKAIKEINDTLKPILEERETQKMLSLIDEVAKESGDDKAQDFIDEYASEIEAELNKISSDFRKTNPKLAIEQAYLKVKSNKIQEWQKSMLKKQEEERASEAKGTDTGTGGNAPVEPEVEPEIAQMKEAIKHPGSAFFNKG